jgi:hypothetical protein
VHDLRNPGKNDICYRATNLNDGSRGAIVSKLLWLIVAALALLFGAAGAGITGFLIAALIIGVPYLVFLRLFPRTRHGACNGTGEVRSRLYPWAFHRCRGCNSGRQIRHGARVFGSQPVRREHRAVVTSRETTRSEHRWR